MKLSAKSENLINKTIEYLKIRENQQFYCQETYKSKISEDGCQTECCIAGWFCWIDNPDFYQNEPHHMLLAKARQLMSYKDNTPVDTYNLFLAGENWIAPFGKQYGKLYDLSEKSKTHKAKYRRRMVELAISRLEHFKQTGE